MRALPTIEGASATTLAQALESLAGAERREDAIAAVLAAAAELCAADHVALIVRRNGEPAVVAAAGPHARRASRLRAADGGLSIALRSTGEPHGWLAASWPADVRPTELETGLLRSLAIALTLTFDLHAARERARALVDAASEVIIAADGGPAAPRTEDAAPPAVQLTPREREVLELLAAGATNSQIAQALVVSASTAKTHVSNLLRKLGVRNRAQAVARWASLLPR